MRELGLDLLVASVGSLEFSLRSDLVREVLGARPWFAIPGARPEVPGVLIWGGRAIAVVDLGRLHGGPSAPSERRSRLLIVASAGCHLALPVDRVSEVFRTHDDNIRPREISDFELARQEVQNGDQVLPLLDAELLLRRLDAEQVA